MHMEQRKEKRRKEDEEQFNELKEKAFGSSFTGYFFSAIHSDLVQSCLIKRQRAPLVPSAEFLVPISMQ